MDIQLHDTYIVLDALTAFALIVGPVAFLIFLVTAVLKRFKVRWINIALIVTFVATLLLAWRIHEMIAVAKSWSVDKHSTH